MWRGTTGAPLSRACSLSKSTASCRGTAAASRSTSTMRGIRPAAVSLWPRPRNCRFTLSGSTSLWPAGAIMGISRPSPGRTDGPSVSALAAQQELAAGLDHRFAAIGGNIGGGVGLAPPFGQVGAGADDIDRRVGGGHHAAFLRAKARAGDDPGFGKAGFVQHLAHSPDRGGGDAGPNEVAQFRFGAIAADRLRRVVLQHLIRAGKVEPLAIAAARRVHAEGEAAGSGQLGKPSADFDRVAGFTAE